MYDILDVLQNIDSYIRVTLKTGEVMYGRPDCILHDEDENGFDTIRNLMFWPWEGKCPVFFYEGEVVSFEEVDEKDIPAVK